MAMAISRQCPSDPLPSRRRDPFSLLQLLLTVYNLLFTSVLLPAIDGTLGRGLDSTVLAYGGCVFLVCILTVAILMVPKIIVGVSSAEHTANQTDLKSSASHTVDKRASKLPTGFGRNGSMASTVAAKQEDHRPSVLATGAAAAAAASPSVARSVSSAPSVPRSLPMTRIPVVTVPKGAPESRPQSPTRSTSISPSEHTLTSQGLPTAATPRSITLVSREASALASIPPLDGIQSARDVRVHLSASLAQRLVRMLEQEAEQQP
jgi:hypothetical protein